VPKPARDEGPTTFVREIKSGDGDGNFRAVVPALTVLWHYDLGRIGKRAPLAGRRKEVSRKTLPFDQDIDVPLSRLPFLIVENQGDAVTLTPAPSKTTVLVDGMALTAPQQIDPVRLKHGVILLLAERIVVCLHQLRTPALPGPDLGFVGASDAMEEVRRQIRQVADLPWPVLIRGQSGTGKELVARAIAAESKSPTPFIVVNMGELAPSTAASDLFGHEKGAYTGAATERPGYFVEADGGTLFLDEIGELHPDVQKMLLRVVEEGRVRPLGGRRERERDVHVRLITATDKDLEAAVAAGTFDDALLNRLRGYRIDLPPLSHRREDIGSLLLHFLKKKLAATGDLHRLTSVPVDERPWLGGVDFMRIARAAYPGNLRDLDNLTNELVGDSRGKPFAVLGPKVEEILARTSTPPAPPAPPAPPRRPGQPTDAEIRAAVRQNNNNLTAAAHALGISRWTLHRRTRVNGTLLRSAEELTDEEILEAKTRHRGDEAAMADELGVSAKALKARLNAILKRPR
jgi:two-component system, NtrC family, nitrogen regulation response regulator GlnG